MLTITIPEQELFDETTSSFSVVPSFTLHLEHSLVSLSKWESKFEKPFLGDGKRTTEESLSYIWAMILDENCPPPNETLNRLSQENIDEVTAYINAKQTATTFGELPKRPGKTETITAELIYYWMIAFNIPFSCETWHLNRLFALIRICNIKNSKPKKMSRNDLAKQYREINERRRKELNTRG